LVYKFIILFSHNPKYRRRRTTNRYQYQLSIITNIISNFTFRIEIDIFASYHSIEMIIIWATCWQNAMEKGQKSELQTCYCDLRNCHCRPPFTNCIWHRHLTQMYQVLLEQRLSFLKKHYSEVCSLICLLTLKLSLYLDSNTDIAASEPDPILANGRVSVDPWG